MAVIVEPWYSCWSFLNARCTLYSDYILASFWLYLHYTLHTLMNCNLLATPRSTLLVHIRNSDYHQWEACGSGRNLQKVVGFLSDLVGFLSYNAGCRRHEWNVLEYSVNQQIEWNKMNSVSELKSGDTWLDQVES